MSKFFVPTIMFCSVLALTPAMGRAHAATGVGKSACWTSDPGDEERSEITCRDLSEATLKALENKTSKEVVQFFGAPGKDHKPTHFEGMDNSTGRYSGNVDFTYVHGRVRTIDALVAQAQADGSASEMVRFIWNPEKKRICSDFPQSQNRCPDE